MTRFLHIALRGMLLGGIVLIATQAKAQLKVGDNPTNINKSAILELESNSQGFLLPRISDTANMTNLNPPNGMIIYLTKTGNEGFYIRTNYNWQQMASRSSSWDLLGNYITDATKQFIGSVNNVPFVMRGNNVEGIRIDNGNVTLSNKVTLSNNVNIPGLTPAANTEMTALIIDATGKVFVRPLSTAAFNDAIASINGSKVTSQTINTDNTDGAAGGYAFNTVTATGTHTLSIATQDGTKTIGLLTKNDWIKFNAAAGKALKLNAFLGTGTAEGLTLGTDGSGNPTIALNAATATTPGGVSTTAQTFAGDKTFTGNITGNNGLNITAGGATINGAATLNNGVTVAGGATISGGATINGDAKLNNNLLVTGTTNLGTVNAGANTDLTVLMLDASKNVIKRTLASTAFTPKTFASGHSGTDINVVDDAVANTVTVNAPYADPSAAGGLVSNKSQSFAGDKRLANNLSVKSTVMVGDTTNLANSTLQVAGSVSMSITTQTADYTLTDADYTVLVNPGAPVVNITLPASTKTGRIVTIKKIGGGLVNSVLIKPQSGTIEGGANYPIYNDWTYVTLQSDGTNWYIIKK
ncbi:hypothetical protein [Chitinophaga vietnamensis]|uniref:hypothetical protein n=1 Tax=Chitinophaga vietnamensis TaxID=2593957 RepID=UPI001177BED4|nr:hypothetical protein [Chitinophaga vietnamensis]